MQARPRPADSGARWHSPPQSCTHQTLWGSGAITRTSSPRADGVPGLQSATERSKVPHRPWADVHASQLPAPGTATSIGDVPRANPAGQIGRAEARIIQGETEIRVVAQVRGVVNLPQRGHVVARGTSRKRLGAVVFSFRQVELARPFIG